MNSSPASKKQPRLRVLTLADKAEVSEMLKDCLLYGDTDYFQPLYDHMVTQAGSHCYGLMLDNELVSLVWLYTIADGSRYVAAGGRTKRKYQSMGYNSILSHLATDHFYSRYPHVGPAYGAQTIAHSDLRDKDYRLWRSAGQRRLLTLPRYMLSGRLSASAAQRFRGEVSTGTPVKRLLNKKAVVELICCTRTASLWHIFGPVDRPFFWNDQACFRLPFDVAAAMDRFGGCLVKCSSVGEVLAVALVTRYLFNESIACCCFYFYGADQFVEGLLAEAFCLMVEEFPNKDYRFILHVGYDAARAERVVLGCAEKCPSLRFGKDHRGNIALIIEYPKLPSKM